MNPEWLSARLDGELSAAEAAEVDAALAADPDLRAELESLGRVRAALRAAVVEPPAGAMERIEAAVHADREATPVVELRARRRVPSVAAVAAAIVIIASVVGGVGGTSAVPALGELVARHDAAAAESEAFMADAVEMPMEEAGTVGPPMPSGFAMQHAFVDGSTVHLVYAAPDGAAVSVFRQEGDTDVDDLPPGTVSRAGARPMWSAPQGARYVVVVDGSGYVWVVVSTEPREAMMVAMMDDLPTRAPGIGERLRNAADAAVGAFRFWD